MRNAVLFLLLFTGVCRADLNFTFVDGADVGIEQVLVPHKQKATAAGVSTWLWGAVGWTDKSGSYLYFSYHRYGAGFLFKHNGDGTYTDISPTPPNKEITRPSETRPVVIDVDNNGYLDILNTGDEKIKGTSLLNMGDGTWVFSEAHKITARTRVVDYNDDGYLDVQGPYRVNSNPGTGGIKTEVNQAGKGFDTQLEITTVPSDAPQEVADRIEAADDRFHMPRIYDLDAKTYIATYGGAYGGEKFTYVVRNGQVTDIGLPETGMAHRPLDVDGDGDLDVVIQHSDAAGVYRQHDDGQFRRDETGDMPTINGALTKGAYEWDIWAIDLDEDGDNDLIMSSKRRGAGWILDNKDGVYRQVHRIFHVDGEGMWPADIDGDGDIDVVVAGNGNARTDMRDSDQAALYINQLDKQGGGKSPQGSAVEAVPDKETGTSAPRSMIPLPDHDPDSQAWARWVNLVKKKGTSASGHALLYAVTGKDSHCKEAIAKAQALVDADKVAGNQYLKAAGHYTNVFRTLSWCDVPASQASEWKAWGERHLGEPDGSVKQSIWWTKRWSRDNPANNYYHSFITATSMYAMATGDEKWLRWLHEDRLPRMFDYYATTPEGGSREGTAYGESHRKVFALAKLWRDFDGTDVVPQAFIDNSLRYWTHATAPGHQWVALIGDQTRTHGRTDGYHRDIIDNALQVAKDPEAIAIGRWQLSQLPPPQSSVFYDLELRDHPAGHKPEATEYYAKGAGHFFARDSWDEDATFLYFTAGKHDEAHQQEDQGAFAVWANGKWQTTSDSPWTHGGIAQDVSHQNVVRFPSAKNIHNSVSTLTWRKENGVLEVNMDLSPAVGQLWQRTVHWQPGSNQLRVTDIVDASEAEFGFEKPGKDDTRAPYVSDAEAKVEPVSDGFRTVIRWSP